MTILMQDTRSTEQKILDERIRKCHEGKKDLLENFRIDISKEMEYTEKIYQEEPQSLPSWDTKDEQIAVLVQTLMSILAFCNARNSPDTEEVSKMAKRGLDTYKIFKD